MGSWVNKQCHRHKGGGLLKEQVDRLNEIGFKWSVIARGNDQFAELKEYADTHGHCDVPQRHGKLGVWVKSQRRNLKREKLSEEQINHLDAIGFKWAITHAKASRHKGAPKQAPSSRNSIRQNASIHPLSREAHRTPTTCGRCAPYSRAIRGGRSAPQSGRRQKRDRARTRSRLKTRTTPNGRPPAN